jgi:CHAD domain-containing protein
MENVQLEREVKFAVPGDFVVPQLADLLPKGGRIEQSSEQLTSVYYDTPDGALLALGVTLRRRTGTTDEGWQLKLPRRGAREEIHLPTEGDTVPEEFQSVLFGVRRGRPLQEVARMRTERTAYRLLDAEGRLLAEVAHDRVQASSAGETATTSSWSEVEVELGQGDQRLMKATGKRLKHAGAKASMHAVKLARALGGARHVPAADRPTVTSVVAAYIEKQHKAMFIGDIELRRSPDDEEVVHETRVATRRFRSTLRTFRDLFDRDRSVELDEELRWWAGLLGDIRDRQVLRRHLDSMIDALPQTAVLGPVRATVDSHLLGELERHWQLLREQMTSDRYIAILDLLAAWNSAPPWTDKAHGPIRVIVDDLARAKRVVAKRLKRALAPTGTDEALHSARKAAKRARYAHELAEPVIGHNAARKGAKRYQTLQDLLGEHHDSIVSAELLRQLGTQAATDSGQTGFTFGILYQREQQNAHTAREYVRRIASRYS